MVSLGIPVHVPVHNVNPDDVDYLLQQETVRYLIEEVGFELDVFRRIIIRQIETTGTAYYQCEIYKPNGMGCNAT